jgi:hypothetical protein
MIDRLEAVIRFLETSVDIGTTKLLLLVILVMIPDVTNDAQHCDPPDTYVSPSRKTTDAHRGSQTLGYLLRSASHKFFKK